MTDHPRQSRRELRQAYEQQQNLASSSAHIQPGHTIPSGHVPPTPPRNQPAVQNPAQPSAQPPLQPPAQPRPAQQAYAQPPSQPGAPSAYGNVNQPRSYPPAGHGGHSTPAAPGTPSVSGTHAGTYAGSHGGAYTGAPAGASAGAPAAQPAAAPHMPAPGQAAFQAVPQPSTETLPAQPPHGDDKDRSHMRAKPVAKPKKRRSFDFITFIGEILVTAGVILGLFAFWQVWVTDWQTEPDKELALSDFRKSVKCVQKVSTDIRTDAPPVEDKPKLAQTFGALHVPSWHFMVLPLKEGTGPKELDLAAAGHYTDTVLPGQIGNFSVAAHRRSRGSSFRHIDDLKKGDKVIVETKKAWYVYRMISNQIVLPTQGDVIAPVPNKPSEKPTKRLMTMTSCHPEYGNSERFIVHLELEYWTPHNAGIPKELAGGGMKCT